jgi:hypothetical protein
MPVWTAQRTLLIVGEGYTEEAFLKHVKGLYVQRGCGLSVTIKNARGKGAKHVIEWTIRQIANASYDTVAVLLDTDTDWSASVAKIAKHKIICVIKSTPCFEALLLRLLGRDDAGDTHALKKRFVPLLLTMPRRSIRNTAITLAGIFSMPIARVRPLLISY